jgi:rod shape-determining protein MreB and related proteins
MSVVELSSWTLAASRERVHPRALLRRFLPHDLAVDLGTANTLIYARGRGIAVNEPSMVAVNQSTGKPVAVGHAARQMFGRTGPSVRCVRPMKDGVIADFEVTTLMIDQLLRRALPRTHVFKPRAVVGVPSGTTQVEKRAVIEALQLAGVRQVLLVEEPMAAALGSGLPVECGVASMIVDIGGGTTEVAVISRSQTLYSHSIRMAGDEMDEAIQRQVRRACSLEIGILEAERIKLVAGTALPSTKPRFTTIYGRDLASGLPREIEVSEELMRSALAEPVEAIISSVVTALEQVNVDAARDIVARGVFLAGGGSLLRGLSERLSRETGLRFYRAEDPLSCVVRGVGKIVDNLKPMRALCIS